MFLDTLKNLTLSMPNCFLWSDNKPIRGSPIVPVPTTKTFFILFFGCVVGTALSQFFGAILPEGVVKDFLLNSTEIGWGSSNEWIDLNVIKFKTGFKIGVNYAIRSNR